MRQGIFNHQQFDIFAALAQFTQRRGSAGHRQRRNIKLAAARCPIIANIINRALRLFASCQIKQQFHAIFMRGRYTVGSIFEGEFFRHGKLEPQIGVHKTLAANKALLDVIAKGKPVNNLQMPVATLCQRHACRTIS